MSRTCGKFCPCVAAYYNQTRTQLRCYTEQSNDLVLSSPCPFYPDYITNMSGYDFRKGDLDPPPMLLARADEVIE